MALAAYLLWQSSWRFGVIKTWPARLLMVLALHLGYGMSFSLRCSRPDILALVCLALMLLAFKIMRRRLRGLALFGMGAVTVWIGFQVALFAGAALFGAWLIFRRVAWREIWIVAAGIALGVCSVLLFLRWKGVLSYFLPVVVGMMGKRYAHSPGTAHLAGAAKVVKDTLSSYADDFSALALAAGLIFLSLLTWKRLTPSTRRLIVYSLAIMFGMPLLFNVTGHWAFYYSYMKFVPLAFAFFAAFAELSFNAERRPGVLIKVPM